MPEERFETDEVLVEGLKAGEQLAQLMLVKRHGPRVKYLIRFISWDLPDEDLKEVANEVFRRVIRGIPGFDQSRGTKFSAWLYQIVANTTREHVRKSKALQARFEAEFESYEVSRIVGFRAESMAGGKMTLRARLICIASKLAGARSSDNHVFSSRREIPFVQSPIEPPMSGAAQVSTVGQIGPSAS